jgi:branched-chain amino acid transport system substrate-binding protein
MHWKSFIIGLSLLGMGACSYQPQTHVIRIGEYGSLTGSEATFGISTEEGIQLAVQKINAQGGIHGKKIHMFVLDDQGQPQEAVIAVTKLITEDHVAAILGAVASSESLAAAPICQRNHVPMISPASTNPQLTQVGNYIFRVCFTDTFQGRVMADFARYHLKDKRIAVLKDQRSAYSVGLAQAFIHRFKQEGGTIVSIQSYDAGDIDFKSQLTVIRQRKPQAIFIPGYYTEVGLIARQARQLGIKVPLLGGDGWDSSKLFQIGGRALNGCYFSTHFTALSQNPRVQKFVKEFKEQYHSTPDALASLGYDAAGVLFQALKASRNLSGASIRKQIQHTRHYQGVTGSITINAHRNAIKSAVILKIENKKTLYIASVYPKKIK